MQCSSCGFENPDDAQFCEDCGGRLELACPSCGTSVRPGQKFCRSCGTRLGPQAPAPTTTTPAAQPRGTELITGERRQVTVLFVDLAGYTRLTANLDAEETHALLGRYFALVDGFIQEFGGSVDKHIGDGVMGVFGAPVSHADDPQRAVEVALAVHEAMRGLSRELGHELWVHIGIASGQVVASGLGSSTFQEYTLTGESVNLASRLESLAGPGQTYVSDAVQRAVADRFEAAPVGEVPIKGFENVVQVFRVVGRRQAPPLRPQRAMVGRRSEVRGLTAMIEACRESGTGQSVYLRGDAGIGKSRLVEEAHAIARQHDFTVVDVRCLDFGAAKGRDPVAALARGLLGIAPGSDKTARRAAVEVAEAAGIVARRERAFVYELLDLPQPPETRAMYGAMEHQPRAHGREVALASLLAAVARKSPLLVTIEDLQWADATALAHLAALVRTVATCPAVLVMTSRIEGDPLDAAWRGRVAGTPLTTFDLAPLRPDEALALAGEYVESINRFAKACIERAAGNPLFLEQLLLSTQDSERDAVPGSIQSLVQARLDRLGADERRAITAAAVLGQRFEPEAVGFLIDDPAYDCQGLAHQFLVRPEGEQLGFVHALVRDVAYASLLNATRRALHRKAAAWYAARDAGLHAEHLDRAGEPAAVEAYLGAARGLAAQYRYEQAQRLAARGLELAALEGDVFALASLCGEILLEMGFGREAIERFEQALAAAGSPAERCRALIGRIGGQRLVGEGAAATALLDEAEGLAREAGLEPERAQVHYHRGNFMFARGDTRGCMAEHRAALELARRTADPIAEAQALSGLGDAHYARGRMIGAGDYYERCLELCRRHGLARIEVANRNMMARIQVYRCDLDGGLAEARTVASLAAEVGHRRAEMGARLALGWIGVERGEIEAARTALEAALGLAQTIGARPFEPLILMNLGRCLLAEEDRAGACEVLEQALAIARKAGFGLGGPGVLGALALATPDPERRQEALEEGMATLEKGCVGHNYYWFYRDGIELGLREGDLAQVARFADAFEGYLDDEPVPYARFVIERARALAAWRAGRHDPALGRLTGQAEATGLAWALPALREAAAGAPLPT
jgi:class 3 adenylate cyclase/tetratricopeptide (TPR) repeat protein